jgi:hypothetical protein
MVVASIKQYLLLYGLSERIQWFYEDFTDMTSFIVNIIYDDRIGTAADYDILAVPGAINI